MSHTFFSLSSKTKPHELCCLLVADKTMGKSDTDSDQVKTTK